MEGNKVHLPMIGNRRRSMGFVPPLLKPALR
jgi:hypothetical protein